jgi:hypothetical protein
MTNTTSTNYIHSSTGTCSAASAYANNDSAFIALLLSMVGVKDTDSLVKWVKTSKAREVEPARPLVDWVNLGYNKFYKGED